MNIIKLLYYNIRNICLKIRKFIKEILDRILNSNTNKGKVLVVELYVLKQDYIKIAPGLSQDSNIPIPIILTIINKRFDGIGLN
ncbi:hypothetical protein C4S77_09125 [Apibacter adventoris]|uniref:Uncharacterized protein n=1 Tax=Apibacter adventoris TaxID=1679466 RepID=A0A2S8A8W2_9FLAO|nr:hypothetical protein C4S77_09125 [Apibacter adventoris]